MKALLFLILLITLGCTDDSYQVSQAIEPLDSIDSTFLRDVQLEPVVVTTKDTGFIWILTDFASPSFTQVGGYKLGNEYFMPDCQDLQDGTRTVNVDVTNIAHGFYPDKRAKYYFNSCE